MSSTPSFLSSALIIGRKDLTLLLGRGTGLAQAFLLGLLIIFIFSLSRGIGETVSAQAAAAIFWVATLFCQVLVFTSLYALEEVNGQRQGLLLAPAPLQSIWLGKGLAGLIMLLLAQLLFLPAVAVFLDQEPQGTLMRGLLCILLTDVGLAAAGSLLGALAQGQAARESLLSIVIFPLLLPLLLAAISTGAEFLGGGVPSGDGENWLRIIMAFDALFLAAGLLLFGFIYNSRE
ncbi:MAG: heme exporter protein CcmB [Deltaproteobacteria bacterium]|jgi:heme exporter protein B|nr:heme exporter protein CcmB [Deltaproteobacteria bacterium]